MRLPQFCLSLCSERTRVLAVQVMLAVRKLAKCLSQNSLHSLKWSLGFFFFFYFIMKCREENQKYCPYIKMLPRNS